MVLCDADEVLRALADRRRRGVRRCLAAHQRGPLADLAEFVAERESGVDVTEIAGERIRSLYLTRYHDHVAVLETAGLVRYDRERDLVAWTEQTSGALALARDAVTAVCRGG